MKSPEETNPYKPPDPDAAEKSAHDAERGLSAEEIKRSAEEILWEEEEALNKQMREYAALYTGGSGIIVGAFGVGMYKTIGGLFGFEAALSQGEDKAIASIVISSAAMTAYAGMLYDRTREKFLAVREKLRKRKT